MKSLKATLLGILVLAVSSLSFATGNWGNNNNWGNNWGNNNSGNNWNNNSGNNWHYCDNHQWCDHDTNDCPQQQQPKEFCNIHNFCSHDNDHCPDQQQEPDCEPRDHDHSDDKDKPYCEVPDSGSTLALFGLGFVSLAALSRRRKAK